MEISQWFSGDANTHPFVSDEGLAGPVSGKRTGKENNAARETLLSLKRMGKNHKLSSITQALQALSSMKA
jgi:hypothetical protein